MAQSLDTLVEKEEKRRQPSWFRNTGLLLAGVGLMLSPSFSNADSTTIYRDNQGRETGYERTINTGPVDTGMQKVWGPSDKYRGQDWREVYSQGMEAYDNKMFREAEAAFDALVMDRPSYMEGHIMQVKSYYQRKLTTEGRDSAVKSAIGMVNIKLERGNNEAIRALGTRIEKDIKPEAFSLSAYQDYLKGMEAYKKEDYSTASKLLRQSVKEDPWNEDGWFYLASSEQRKTGEKTKKHAVWKEAVKYHNSFQEEINKFCK